MKHSEPSHWFRRAAGFCLCLICVVHIVFAMRFVRDAYLSLPRPVTLLVMSDFGMRYNEASCVREGVNPFDIWRGAVVDARYDPWSFARSKVPNPDFSRFVHAYPPWEYTCLLPFVGLDRRAADYVFMGLMFGGLLFLSGAWFVVGSRQTGKVCFGMLMLAICWCQASPVTSCLVFGNFGIWISVSVAVALYCHARNWDGWAGVFWALAMVKPQIAAIFVVPLLLLHKFRTLLVVGILLFMGTLAPAAFCRCSPIELVTCISEYSSGQFARTGFIGSPVFMSLVDDGGCSPSLLSGASALAGCLVCAVCTSLLLHGRSGGKTLGTLTAFVPALVLSTIWTASRIHDFCIHSVTAPLLLLIGFGVKDLRFRIAAITLALLTSQMFRDQYRDSCVNAWMMLSMVALAWFCYGYVRAEARNEKGRTVNEVAHCYSVL